MTWVVILVVFTPVLRTWVLWDKQSSYLVFLPIVIVALSIRGFHALPFAISSLPPLCAFSSSPCLIFFKEFQFSEFYIGLWSLSLASPRISSSVFWGKDCSRHSAQDFGFSLLHLKTMALFSCGRESSILFLLFFSMSKSRIRPRSLSQPRCCLDQPCGSCGRSSEASVLAMVSDSSCRFFLLSPSPASQPKMSPEEETHPDWEHLQALGKGNYIYATLIFTRWLFFPKQYLNSLFQLGWLGPLSQTNALHFSNFHHRLRLEPLVLVTKVT